MVRRAAASEPRYAAAMLGTALRVAVALASVAATSSAQQRESNGTPADPIVRTRSLAPLAPPHAQRSAPRASAMPRQVDPTAMLPLDTPGEARAPDWVVELLQQRHRGALDDGSLRIELGGGATTDDGRVRAQWQSTVVFAGDRQRVDAAVRDFDALLAIVGRPIEVSVHRLPLADGALPACLWDPATTSKQLQATPPLWTSRAHTRSGAELRLGDQELRGVVADLDVEVAERVTIFDPKVDAAFAGLLADLTVHALPGEGLQLRGSWLLSEPVSSLAMPIGTDRPSVDLPEHRTAYVSFAGTILSGGALVVSGRGGPLGPAGFQLVVSARYLAPPAAEAGPDLLVRPVGAFLAGSSAPQLRGLAWRLPGVDLPQFAQHDADGGLNPTELLRLLQGQQPGGVELFDGILIARGDVAANPRCNRLLAQLAADMATARLVSRVATDAAGAAGAADAIELAQPVLGGHGAAAFVGRERMLIRDFEVEIAARAAASNPVLDTARSGLWLCVLPLANGPTWHVSGNWSLARHGAPRPHEHDEVELVVLHQTDVRTTTLPWQAPMPLDQDHVLGNGPAWADNGPPTTLRVRLGAN
jgi:hypothetical protein